MSDIARKRLIKKNARRTRARYRVRRRISGTAERPRLSVHKSLRVVYAQIINDETGETIAQANSGETDVRGQLKGSGAATKEAARYVGELVARRGKGSGIRSVVFDRGSYIYHGKIKALAEGARAEGLEF